MKGKNTKFGNHLAPVKTEGKLSMGNLVATTPADPLTTQQTTLAIRMTDGTRTHGNCSDESTETTIMDVLDPISTRLNWYWNKNI